MSVCFSLYLSAEETWGPSSSRVSLLSDAASDRLQATKRSRPNSPDPLASAVTEMFISEENISQMENILDTWSNNLKVDLLSRQFTGSYLLSAEERTINNIVRLYLGALT